MLAKEIDKNLFCKGISEMNFSGKKAP